MCEITGFLECRTDGHKITLTSLFAHIQWIQCVCETEVCLQWSYAWYSTGNSRPWIYCFQGSRRLRAPGVCPHINITMTHIDPTTARLLHHWDKVASIATEKGLAWWLRKEWRKIGTQMTSHGNTTKKIREKCCYLRCRLYICHVLFKVTLMEMYFKFSYSKPWQK